MKPFLLKASCKDYIWGGNRLREFGKASDAAKIAESWELSTHPDGESVIASGEYAGMTLMQFLKQHPEAAGAGFASSGEFPVIVKLIDAHDNLSIQVHPDKTELWYVVDAEPGASILYGFREEVTQEEFRAAIENGTLLEKMKTIPVKPGDVFLIPAGTLHAIGKGILIAEVQQNSNNTYRVYDYDRGRELHIEQAMEVTSLTPSQKTRVGEVHPIIESASLFQFIGGCSHFSAARYEIRQPLYLLAVESFVHLLVLDGEVVLTAEDEALHLKKGDSVFIPAQSVPALSGNGSLLAVQNGEGAWMQRLKRQ